MIVCMCGGFWAYILVQVLNVYALVIPSSLLGVLQDLVCLVHILLMGGCITDRHQQGSDTGSGRRSVVPTLNATSARFISSGVPDAWRSVTQQPLVQWRRAD